MSILSKLYRTNNPKIYMEIQKTHELQKQSCEKKNKAGGIMFPNLDYATRLP